MKQPARNILLVLFAAAYFAATQMTVIAIVSAWYSTAADSAVAAHRGPSRDLGVPSWTPRTHPLVFHHAELSQGVPASPFHYPSQQTYRIIQAEDSPGHSLASYFAELCNKAPPQA
jgi:hypothetical protein